MSCSPKQLSRIVQSALCLVLLFSLTGCGGGGGGSSPGPALSLSSAQTKGFVATLSEDKAAVAVGGTVTYTLTVTNTSGVVTALAVPSGTAAPDVFLQIVNKEGIVVYPIQRPGEKPNDAPPPVPINGFVNLQPGQSVAESLALSVFSAADTYNATATFQISTSASDPQQAVSVGPLAVIAH